MIFVTVVLQTLFFGTAALVLKRLVLLFQKNPERETRTTLLGLYGAAAAFVVILHILGSL